ncbi:MAG: amidohydrolase [Lachnospiraceae bacterium]|nr:amidohydrolase [Lachnospiraceae bacterium]
MVQTSLSDGVKEELRAILPELIAFRRDLHQHPEPSGREAETARKVRKNLEAYGYTVRSVGKTGLYTVLHGKEEGPDITLRADMDALPITEQSTYPYPSKHPGLMHACGHDVHTTAVLGAARYLALHKEKLSGTVRFLFQHAEEQGHGSQDFLKEGLTEGTERIYGFHVSPQEPLGCVVLSEGADFASCDSMKIRLFGDSAHIARPHMGSDVTLCAADLILHLHTLKSLLDPLQPALIGVGKVSSGTAWNVLSDHGEIEGTVRCFSETYRKQLLGRVEQIIESVCKVHHVRAEVEFDQNAPCLINDREAGKTMQQAAEQAVGKDNVFVRQTPFGFGADDFAAFTGTVPGCFLHVGTAIDSEPGSKASLHSPGVYIPDEAVGIGCEILIRCALFHLENAK